MKTSFEVPVPADQQLSLAPLAYVGLGVAAAVVSSVVLSSTGIPTVLAVLLPIAIVVAIVTVLALRGAAKARKKYAADLEVFLNGIKEATGSTLVTNGQIVNFNDLPEYAVLEDAKGRYSRWSLKKDGTSAAFKELDKSVVLPR